jgi:phenylacetate-CoA ligase
VVDDEYRPTPPGEKGSKLLLTNLFMRTQPLIRYEIDDMITVDPHACPCGRPFPVLKTVDGRSDESLRLSDGRGGEVSVHPMHFRSPLGAERDVRQYQVVQRTAEILLQIVPAEGADRTAVERRLVSTLEEKLVSAGAGLPTLRVEFVDEIERDPEKMSKLKLVRSELQA